MNQNAALVIYFRLLAEVIRPVKELAPRRIHRRQKRETLLNRFPLGQRVNTNVVSGKTCYVEFAAVLFVDQTPEWRRHFKPTLRVDPGGIVSSQHRLPTI